MKIKILFKQELPSLAAVSAITISFNGTSTATACFFFKQLRDLMVYLEAGKAMEQLSVSDEIKDGTVLPIPLESSSGNGLKGKHKG